MKRKVLSVLLAASMVLAMTACGAKEEAPAEAPAAEAAAPAADAAAPAADAAAPAAEEGTKKVGVILKTLSSEYWGYVAAGVNAAAADLGVDVDLQGPANEQAYDEQNNQIETMLTAGVDAFVIAPLQSDSVASVIGSQNIPILTVDTDADIPGKVAFVGTGNENAAYEGGKFAASKAAAGAKAVIIAGDQGNSTSDAREAGYKKALEEAGIEVVGTDYAQSQSDKAASIMENMLQANPDITIVCCHNDDTAVAAAKVCKDANRSDVLVVGFDGCQSGVKAVLAGDMTATCAQSAYGMGYKCVEAAVKAINGESVESFVDTGCTVVNADNAQKYLDELISYVGEQ